MVMKITKQAMTDVLKKDNRLNNEEFHASIDALVEKEALEYFARLLPMRIAISGPEACILASFTHGIKLGLWLAGERSNSV